MPQHVGVLPADLLQLLSKQLLEQEAGALRNCSPLRLLKLPHPRTATPTLFLPYELPDGGNSVILEVQAVSPPNARSWFLSEEVLEDGKLLVMTPIDPVFLLIPLLRLTQPTDGLGQYRPAEDLFEDAANKLTINDASSLDDILHLVSLRCVQTALRRVCEFKEITSEIIVYRYSPECVQNYLRSKVSRLSLQNISQLSRTITRSLAKDGLFEDGKDDLLIAGRLRCACDLVSQYISREVYDQLVSSYDFTALDENMKNLKEEAMAMSAKDMNAVEAKESGTTERKGSTTDKKRKAKGSTGVEKLKKANIKGMSKLSSFFQKK